MSRRYPIEAGACATCGRGLMAKDDGTERPHLCEVGWDGTRTPWAFYSEHKAASILGVEPELLRGLTNHRSAPRGRKGDGRTLRAHKVVLAEEVGWESVQVRWRYNAEDVDALARTLTSR